MKRLLALLALSIAVALPAQSTATYPAAKAKATPAAPAPTAGGKTDGKKQTEKEEEPKIQGQTVARTTEGFLGIELVNGTFKISFYNAKKKPVPANVGMAVARWLVKYNKSGDDRAVLLVSGDGKALVGDKLVRSPYSFRLYLSLFKETTDDAQAVESYIIDFSA